MKRKLILELLAIIAVFGTIWWGLAQIPYFNEAPSLTLSSQKERQLGKILKEQFVRGEEEVTSGAVDSARGVIMKRLKSGIDTSSDHDYKITIIANERANAFALPGGHIIVFSGLLELADKPEEVAAVLAHEIGHIHHNHVVERLTKQLGVTVLFTALGGDQMVVGELAKMIVSTSFDRKQEKEADQYAFALMEEVHLNPSAMATFFIKLKQEKPNMPSELKIISSHPNTASRIKKANEYTLPDDFEEKPIEIEWARVTEALATSSDSSSLEEKS